MKYAQKVKKRYLTILNDMAKNRDSYVKNPEKDFTRKRKLSFQDTINTIVTYDAGSIGRCIKRYIPKVEKTPTTSAFLQQQKKLKLSAFETLFYRFNDPFPDKTLHNLHILSVDEITILILNLMTLRSSCDSIKTPMEFDCCSHAIFLLFLPHTGKSTLQIPQFNRFQ